MSLAQQLFFCFFFFSTASLSFPLLTPHESRLIKSIPPRSLRLDGTQEYLEVNHPLPTDNLTPLCSLLALNYSFDNTVGEPPVDVPYSPPPNCSWSQVVLEFSAESKGDQYDRIAGVWIDGAELLRTSTAQPTAEGIFWKVRKDVTKYSSLLSQTSLTLSVMLENVVDDVLTGVYDVNVSLFYYGDADAPVPGQLRLNRKDIDEAESNLGLVANNFVKNQLIQYRNLGNFGSFDFYENPADLIIPISRSADEGFWFRTESENDIYSKRIQIPSNTSRAVLEVYLSFHHNDEFWYWNPPDNYISANNLTTERGHGVYREVQVTIDGNLVGSTVPFPVIFTGGINPLFWGPVVGIGAFNLPSYDFDITPYLGFLLDGKVHEFGLRVANSISFWLVDANLHLWLDDGESEVQASSFGYNAPSIHVESESSFSTIDGTFDIEVNRKSNFAGWVNSTAGNFTTSISQQQKVKNSVKFRENGTKKRVKQKVKTEIEVKVTSETGKLIRQVFVKRSYPLTINTRTQPGTRNSSNTLMMTDLSHGFEEETKINDVLTSSIVNSQEANGWVVVVEDKHVIDGGATTKQRYSFRDKASCYTRVIAATNGQLVQDTVNSICSLSF